jgi:Icc protein
MGTPSTCFQFKPESTEFGLDTSAPGYRSLKLYADGRIESDITRLSGQLEGLEFNSEGY